MAIPLAGTTGLAAPLAIGLCLTACACAPRHGVSTGAARSDLDSLHGVIASKNEKILDLSSRLQRRTEELRALEEQLEQTREVLDYAEKQFITLERGLQNHETKASAVSSLAEAKFAYDEAHSGRSGTNQRANIEEAKEKIERSEVLLTKRRYAASVYFSRRAMRLLEGKRESETIRIVSVDKARLRGGPGREHDVIDVLGVGTVLVQLEYAAPWLLVETRGGRSGWIHESTLDER